MILVKPFLPDQALADVVVAVNPGPARPLGIVGVHRRQTVQPDVPVELVDHAGHAFRIGQVIARRERVLGVQADAQPIAVHLPSAPLPTR